MAAVCAATARLPAFAAVSAGWEHATPATVARLLDRVTWGVTVQGPEALAGSSVAAYLRAQLQPGPDVLPGLMQAHVDALRISHAPLTALLPELGQQLHQARKRPAEDGRKQALKEVRQVLNALQEETTQRFVLRALHSPWQLREKMAWFWMNHFSIFAHKGSLRAMVADYEERAIRPHALGRFRNLLGAVTRHPAMLRYLDNAKNAAGRINENLARELMELHTLGVDGGYTQQDVQELARVLTGVGITLQPPSEAPLRLRPALQRHYVRDGLFEFMPHRHDWEPKTLLGQPLRREGLAELDEALDRLARAPATARHIARKLALYLVGDAPPADLVAAMARTFERTDGDIAAVLATLFDSPAFAASLGQRLRDPTQYLMAAMRLLATGTEADFAAPGLAHDWLQRLSQPLYGRPTPDGYPLDSVAWVGSGQMVTRFDAARSLSAGLAAYAQPLRQRAAPAAATVLQHTMAARTLVPTWSQATRNALAQASMEREWNFLFLSAPEFMHG